MSWCCKVDNKWEEFYERDLPAHIIGRFAQSMHSTITRVSNSTQKKLIQALYKSRTEKNYEIPKIKLKEKDFHEALNPKELEDLVYEYIINQEGNENYKLLPSQCAKSKIKYEYSLINEENYKDVITCQVKNIADVNYKKYIDDGKEFSKIYLFSGIGEYNEKTEEEAIKDIEQIKNREKSKKRIVVEIIKREELYDFLTKKSKFVKKMLIQSGYYEF